MAGQEIKTSIDSLVAYLKEHGETNISVVASVLGVGEATIIEWSNILEKANVIRIVNRSGRMFLSLMEGGAPAGNGMAAPTDAEVKVSEESEQMHIEADIASQIAAVNQISSMIDQFSKSISTVDETFKTKYKDVKPFLDKVNAVQARIDTFEKRMETNAKHLEEIRAQMQKEFDALQKYSTMLSGFTLDTNNARGIAEDIRGRLNLYNANMDEMSKALDQLVYRYRKNALEMRRDIRDKTEQLVQIVNLEEKQMREYEKTGKDYKRDSAVLIRNADNKRKAIFDEFDKTMSEVKRLSDVAGKDLTGLKSRSDELKKQLGDMSGINDTLLSIKKDLDAATEQRNALLKSLNTMMQDAKDLSSRRRPAEKQMRKNALKNRTESASETIEHLREAADTIGNKFKSISPEKGDARTQKGKEDVNG